MSSSALRALQILEIISTAPAPIGVTAIAHELRLSAATVFRSLDALERLGYIARYQSSTDFVAGDMARQLRQSAFARFHLRDALLPYMRQMSFATGESVSLTVPVGWYGVTIGAVTGANPVRHSATVGSIGHLASDLPSRVILASLTDDSFSRFLAWARRTGVKVGKDLTAELHSIKSLGYGTQAVPLAEGRASVALPIRCSDRTLASISIEGPVLGQGSRTDKAKLDDWMNTIRSIESRIEVQRELFSNPYAHVDPDTIELPISRDR
ncbi:IclR family transcriptional regulator (plasmid) [Paraburkholderia strydomiana]